MDCTDVLLAADEVLCGEPSNLPRPWPMHKSLSSASIALIDSSSEMLTRTSLPGRKQHNSPALLFGAASTSKTKVLPPTKQRGSTELARNARSLTHPFSAKRTAIREERADRSCPSTAVPAMSHPATRVMLRETVMGIVCRPTSHSTHCTELLELWMQRARRRPEGDLPAAWGRTSRQLLEISSPTRETLAHEKRVAVAGAMEAKCSRVGGDGERYTCSD